MTAASHDPGTTPEAAPDEDARHQVEDRPGGRPGGPDRSGPPDPESPGSGLARDGEGADEDIPEPNEPG